MPDKFLPNGTPAPSFELTAIYTRRKLGLKACAGTPLLLTFISQATRDAVRAISAAVREEYPRADQVIVANLINLEFVPMLARGVVEKMMANALQQAVKEIPTEYDPKDYLILLPDWKGNVTKSYRVGSVDKQVALVMVDASGIIQGSYQGDDPAGAAVRFVMAVLGSSS